MANYIMAHVLCMYMLYRMCEHASVRPRRVDESRVASPVDVISLAQELALP